MSEAASPAPHHPRGHHRYQSVVDGIALANAFARSRLTISAFAREQGVSFRMVKYWSTRARQLAAASSPDLVQVAEVSAGGVITPVTPAAVPALPAPTRAPSPTPGASSTAPPVIEVRLPNGVRIGVGAGFSPEMLAQVIACVGSGASC